MSDISGVTNYFPTANEGFKTTTSAIVTAGATTVPLNSVAGLTAGTVFVGIIEPGVTGKQQVFTGTVSVVTSTITNVVWTTGTNTDHALGVTVVDYNTGTGRNMITAGMLKQHKQDGSHSNITATSVTTTADITIGGALRVGGNLIQAGAWTDYASTWAAGTSPFYGNATLTGRYIQVGKTVTFNFNVTFGSTTTFGSGEWNFTVPVTPKTTQLYTTGAAWGIDTGTNYYSGVARLNMANGRVNIYSSAPSGIGWANTTPFTWGSGDQLAFTITYEAA